MEHVAPNIRTAFVAAALGLTLPAVASAQVYPSSSADPDSSASASVSVVEEATAPQLDAISDAIASMSERTQALADLSPITADNVVTVSLGDLGLTAEERYSLMQSIDPSKAASLQQTLGTVMVAENGSLAGYQRSLADHLTLIGVDPTSVIAVNVESDGTVTLYYQ
jgi:hypothetical protein